MQEYGGPEVLLAQLESLARHAKDETSPVEVLIQPFTITRIGADGGVDGRAV